MPPFPWSRPWKPDSGVSTMSDDGNVSRQAVLPLSEEMRARIVHRLRRLEGQVRGVQRMVEDDRDCQEVLHQLAAIKAAAHSLGAVILEHYVLACLTQRSHTLSPEETGALVHAAVRQMTY
jgi:DNA-binding FrmR family transcriptional regulator